MANNLRKLEDNPIEDTLNKTLEARRLELTTNLKKSLTQLLVLGVDTEDKEENDSYIFTQNMCLSECFRSIGYWENQLFQTINLIQKQKNEKVQ